MPTSLPWKAVATADGSITFASPDHGQLCHSKAGAWTEARERYAGPCQIEKRCLSLAAEGRPLRLLDVGTGAGWNVVAAWQALDRARATDPRAALEIWTLEESTGVLAAALAAPPDEVPPEAALHYAGWREVLTDFASEPLCAGSERHVERPGLSLTLLLGDARETLGKIPAEIEFEACFFDAFSPGVDPPLWGGSFLHAVGARLAPGGILSTYTASLEVRARLVHDAGLQVGRGPRACGKSQGTLAVRPPGPLPEPFDPRTARKLESRVRRKAGES